MIVDEAQDLGRHEWTIATLCAREPLRILCFADEGQAFWGDREIPETIRGSCALYNLGKPYRCPPGIQAFEAYLGKELDMVAVEADKGKGIIGVRPCEEGRLHQDVGEEVRKLVAEGFKPGEIAVISLRGLLFPGSIVNRKQVGGYEAAMATDSDMSGRIVCDTFLRYKGLERPVIIVTDIQHDVDKYGVRMNIAISRAFGVLRIVVTHPELEKDATLMRTTGETRRLRG